jgi:TolB-like protein
MIRLCYGSDMETNAAAAARHGTPYFMNGVLVEPDALRISSGKFDCQVQPMVMTLLVVLSEHCGQLCTRDELMARIWAGEAGTDETLTRLVYLLRKALKSVAASADAVRTVPKRGYRLDAEVWAADDKAGEARVRKTFWPAFSVGVLPVQDVSTNGDGKLLADGLTRDLTMLLARTPQFRVAPYSSAARFDARAPDMAGIAEALHARYLVSATLARFDETVSIRVELSDAAEGVLLWAEKYQTAFDQFFEIQEAVVCSITTAIAAKVNVTQPVRMRRTGRFNLTAYERVQGAETLRSDYGRENAGRIVELLREALAIEPDDPVTQAALAVQLSQNVVSQWAEDPAATVSEADELIAQALQAASNDPEVRAGAGIVATMFHRPDDAIAHLELATARNPNDAHALAVLGWQLCLRHSDPGGIGLIETAEARAPHHPRFGLWATYRATAHLFMLDYRAGLLGAEDAIARTPSYYQPHLTCAWAHTGLGDAHAAKRQIEMARELESGEILGKFIDEMIRWSKNSPRGQHTFDVLQTMSGFG